MEPEHYVLDKNIWSKYSFSVKFDVYLARSIIVLTIAVAAGVTG